MDDEKKDDKPKQMAMPDTSKTKELKDGVYPKSCTPNF